MHCYPAHNLSRVCNLQEVCCLPHSSPSDTKERKAVHTKIKNLFVALGMLSFLVQLSLLCLTHIGLLWAPRKKNEPALLIYRSCLLGSLQYPLQFCILTNNTRKSDCCGIKKSQLFPTIYPILHCI